MPSDNFSPDFQKKRKIAVIGGGISGMGAALSLSQNHEVTLFEPRTRLGGHARTKMAGPKRDIPVDTGFMVFNYKNYPNLNALFEQLEVPVKRSNMTFAVSLDDGRFEYGLQNLGRIFADPANAVSPRFWRMLKEVLSFNKTAHNYLDRPETTLGALKQELGLSDDFLHRYLGPLAGAIWSTSSEDMLKFPAQTLIRFFENHGLLSASGGPLWYTPDGGSKIYVEKLESRLRRQGAHIRLNTGVNSVRRSSGGVKVFAEGNEPENFDDVIFACHSDQALKILADPTTDEQRIIGSIRYKKNDVILHCDTRQMPRRRACWSSWTYVGRSGDRSNNSFTYWMNLLQAIPNETPVFVTLNPQKPIAPECIYDATTLAHPQYDLPAIKAQKELPAIQGANNTWFCGAYTRYGFHEDGLASGYAVADLLNGRMKAAA